MTLPGLHIITSNQMEVLAAGLAELLRSPPDGKNAHPLHTETVMVQSKGMQRWVCMAVARHNGICANLEFPFPNAFLEKLYVSLIGALPEFNPYEPHATAFRILQLLPRLLEHEVFKPLRRYLSSDQRPLKQYQLARKIADIFDQYMIFRPEILRAWENDQPMGHPTVDTAWQSMLWRAVANTTRVPHRSALQHQLVQLLKDARIAPVSNLPDRLSVFGISHLPPFHLEVLDAMAQRIPVYLFLLNPCRHFWFDILSDHQIGRLREEHETHLIPADDLYLDRGNQLLASLGHLGRQFFDMVHQLPAQITEAFVDDPPESLLVRIQQDILDLTDRTGGMASDAFSVQNNDDSLRIHCCHSPMREIEILYDQILEMLNRYSDLKPRDILVMTPDIALYAPFIHAVFGAADHHDSKIPYSVADQNILNQGPVVETFLQLLAMVGGRFEASQAVSLLESNAVYPKFGLTSADLNLIERWVQNVGIQWGWDRSERRKQGLPGFKENTWRTGLDRLALGYAMANEDERLFADILPFDGIGAGEGAVLGRFLAFAETLHDIVISLSHADSPAGWHRHLTQAVDRFLLIDQETEYEIQALHRAIQFLLRIDGFDTPETFLPFEVIKQYLTDTLRSISFESGFMAGGVTFCAMLPMRSIPAQAICLLGMNHDAFPREQHEPGFNLIAAEPRSGDRSKRNDDRYIFLETLISARKILYISYVGRDIQDNAVIPPSVVVEELIDYAVEGFGIPTEQLVTVHPLHGFSSSYFDGSHPLLFSYSRENKDAAMQLAMPGKERGFLEHPLSPPDENWRRCRWSDLAVFFSNPTRYLLEQRLGLWLRASSDIIIDRESFTLDALQRYQVSQRLFSLVLHGKSQEESYLAIRAGGLLPHGTVGKILFENISDEVMDYLGALDQYIGENKPVSVPVEMAVPPYFLHGTIDAIYPTARIVCRLGNLRPKDLLDAFIQHLAMLVSSIPALPKQTFLICKNEIWHFGKGDESDSIVQRYLELYWQGMHAPLHFFSRTSFEYAHQVLIKERSPKEALSAARIKWQGNDFSPGESQDPYFMRCFGDNDVLTPDFENNALAVFSPIFSAGSRIAAGVVNH